MVSEAHYRSSLELYRSAIALLGGQPEKAEPFFDAIWQSGLQPRRFFHSPTHYLNVAGEQEALQRKASAAAPFSNPFKALRFKAGCEHDVAYVHIDHKAGSSIHPEILAIINQLAHIDELGDGCVQVKYRFESASEREKTLIMALNQIFNHPADAASLHLEWYHNQNEYLSALFALSSGLALGMDDKWLLAEMAMIEATVPFGAPGRLPALRARLLKANALLKAGWSNEEIDAILRQAEAISNRDVGDFELYFGDFVANSFLLLLENSKGAVSATNAYAIDPVLMATTMSGMADFLNNIADASEQTTPTRCIFHLSDGSRHAMEDAAIENIRKLSHYLREASTDLQLLCNDFNSKHLKMPKHWGAICQHLGTAIETTPQSALAFFHTLGAQILKDYAGGYRPRCEADTPAPQPLLKLMQLTGDIKTSTPSNDVMQLRDS